MSFRVKDTLLFVAVSIVLVSQAGQLNFWVYYATGWALGRWLAVLLEEWDEEGKDDHSAL